jgi:hypothetical protein
VASATRPSHMNCRRFPNVWVNFAVIVFTLRDTGRGSGISYVAFTLGSVSEVKL